MPPKQPSGRYPSIQSLAPRDTTASLARGLGDGFVPTRVKFRQPVLRQVVDTIMSIFDSTSAENSRLKNSSVSTMGLPAFKEQMDVMRQAMVRRKSESDLVKGIPVTQPKRKSMNDTLRQKLVDNLAHIAKAESKPTALETLMFHRALAIGGMGRMGGPEAAGPGGSCVCPKCGTTVPHSTGTPCSDRKCPECGASMGRGTTE